MNPYAMQVVSLAVEVERLRQETVLGDMPRILHLEESVTKVIELLQRADTLLEQTEAGAPYEMPPEVKAFLKEMTNQMKKGDL